MDTIVTIASVQRKFAGRGNLQGESMPRGPHAFEQFLDAASGKKDVALISAREAAARSTVMEAMYKAAAGRTWIEIEKA